MWFDLPIRQTIAKELLYVNKRIDNLAQEIDDLNAAYDKVSAAVSAAVTDIQAQAAALAAAIAASDGPAVEDAVNKFNALADTLNAAVTPPVVDPSA